VRSRKINSGDLDWIHALNEAHSAELSSLSRERLVELVEGAFYGTAIDDGAAFMLAFDQHADYDSPNFLWFKQRIPRFIYVDRVVVSSSHRRLGLARGLYEDLFRYALARDHVEIVCEVNTHPPNPMSDAFHASLGFELMGEASLGDRAKSVRYLRRDLT
jgi:predicted GNAT superfamily acetyltransferase